MSSGREPPTYPTDLNELSDAVFLCGMAQSRRHMSQYQQARLVRYVGRMPVSKTEAARWKIWLRALLKEAQREPEE